MQGAGLLTACLCTLVVFLVLSGQVRPAEATRDNWDIEDNDDVLYWIDRFALKEDGTWSMQIDPVQKGVTLRMLVCTDGQYDDTIDGWSDSDGRKVCTKIAQNKTKCAVKEFQGFANMTGVARSRDMYWFVLVNCNQTKIDVEFYEEFINPGDEYLGWDTIPLPYIYGILIIVYAVLLLAWIGNIVLIDWGAGSNRLHKYISLWPVMKLWLLIFNTAYWGYLSEKGVMSWGVDVIYVIYNSLWYSYFFGALLLIGLAWGISRKGMGWIEAGVFIAVEVVFYVTWVINFALEGYYVVVSIFGLGCMLIVIFFFTSFSAREVDKAIKNSQSVGPAQASASAGGLVPPPNLPQGNAPGAELNDVRYQRSKLTLQERHRVLKLFMWVHLGYIIPMIAWALIYAGLFHYHTWAYRMLNEASELALVIVLGWMLRLRRRNLYFEFNDDALVDWENRPHAEASQNTSSIEMDTMRRDGGSDQPDSSTFHNPARSDLYAASDDDLSVMSFPAHATMGRNQGQDQSYAPEDDDLHVMSFPHAQSQNEKGGW
jgi:hypothetical protein